MRYLSVCAGIEAATVAWHDLGWEAAAYSEIEKFPCEVLKHHYPNVVNVGDMTKFEEWQIGSIDLLVGGTPCQSFSVAGLRKGLDDPRGNLMLTYGAIAKRFRPKWLVWENVAGVLSSNRGRDFGTFLGMLGELGYGFAYRVLDAQYFGVAQRRRRVFVVGCLRDWRRAAAVLFERDSLCGNPAPSRTQREGASTFFESSLAQYRQDNVGGTLKASGGVLGGGSETFVRYPKDIPEGQGVGIGEEGDPSHTLTSACVHGVAQPIACQDVADPLTACFAKHHGASGGKDSFPRNHITQSMAVRRLTPIECERLQGFPDNHTAIPWKGKDASQCPDGPRYKALGNSMAVPVMRWIGKRIQSVEGL